MNTKKPTKEEKEKADKARKRRIKREEKRLAEQFKEIENRKKELVAGLIERASFMRIQCEDLEVFLNENGWTEQFCQGNQEPYSRARPEGQSYQTLNKNYQAVTKQLTELLPKEEPKQQKTDGFEDFVYDRE